MLGRKSIVLTLCASWLLIGAGNSAFAADPASRVVVWSGGLAPHSVLRGVVLDHGELTPMSSTSDKTARIHDGAVIHPSKAALAAIDAAVKLAAAGKAVAFTPVSGGMYATAAFSGAKHGVVGLNADTPGLGQLIAALNQVLGKSHQLFDPALPSIPIAAKAVKSLRDTPSSFTDDCSSSTIPWKVGRELPLQDAARMGLVTIDASNSGNVAYPASSVFVTARYARTSGPIHISETIQIIPPPDQPGKDYSEQIQKALDSQLKGYKLGEGKNAVPVIFDIKVIRHTSQMPMIGEDPCILSVYMVSDPNYRSNTTLVTGAERCDIEFCYGHWAVNNSPSVYAHEVLHSLGLPDAYRDCFLVQHFLSLDCYLLPVNGLDQPGFEAQLASALEKWGLKPSDGKMDSYVRPEDENNIMAQGRNPKARITDKDLEQLTRQKNLRIQGKPGTVLLDKRTQFGELVTGSWDISVRPPGTTSTYSTSKNSTQPPDLTPKPLPSPEYHPISS